MAYEGERVNMKASIALAALLIVGFAEPASAAVVYCRADVRVPGCVVRRAPVARPGVVAPLVVAPGVRAYRPGVYRAPVRRYYRR